MSHEYGCTHAIQVNPADTTPMLRQYMEVKQQYPGVLLLYQMGDFYETFLEDAIIAARVLEITLTARDAGKIGKIPMAGIPIKAADNYLFKLLTQQFKVAICEQVEDVAQAKGLVNRRVVRVLSAGTLTDGPMLSPDAHNYVASVSFRKNSPVCGLAWCEVSTGQFWATEVALTQLPGELDRLQANELLVAGRMQRDSQTGVMNLIPEALVSDYMPDGWTPTAVLPSQLPERPLCELLEVGSLDGFGLADKPLATDAASLIALTLKQNFPEAAPRLNGLQWVNLSQFVTLNAGARRNLELFETAKTRKMEGSLFSVLNHCKTAMGTRLLRDWLGLPLQDVFELTARLETVDALTQDGGRLFQIRECLVPIADLERLSQKVAQASAMPRDLTALANSLRQVEHLAPMLLEIPAFYAMRLHALPPEVTIVAELIQQSLVSLPPINLKEGGLFQTHAHPDLEQLQHTLAEQQVWLTQYEAQERERSGLKGLKIQFTQAFGFYIELPKAQARQAPENYQRKQTLTNAERFTTPELKRFESDVQEAQGRLLQLEFELFLQLRTRLQPSAPLLRDVAHRVAALDVLASFAHLSLRHGYTRPLLDKGTELHLVKARHPVVEQLLPLGQFVANDCKLAGQGPGTETPLAPQVLLITGPNMAGKSTYMRQIALIVLMAQIGCFIPAEYGRVGIVDAIFTRVGAVDDLSTGQSTFMVEMQETAQILHGATHRSLVLLDEVGRGTSTYDGVSIAWSVVEHLAQHNRCRSLFATHYHELNVLEGYLPTVQNVRVCVAETEGEIVFLHRVEPGTAQKSYGIQVARMAGLPKSLIQRADSLLSQLQRRDIPANRKNALPGTDGIPVDQLSFF